jgi:chromosome segregation protein
LSAEIANLEETRVALQSSVEEHTLRCDACQNAERIETANMEDLKRAFSSAQSQVDRAIEQLTKLLTEIHSLQTRLEVNDAELKNLRTRILETHHMALDELTPEQLKELSTPEDLEILADFEAAKTRVNQLRSRIDNLGKINMVAIDEYTDLSRRYEYLYVQRQDLIDAVKQLDDAIAKIDREARARFAEAFQAVNESFRDVFPNVFGGGRAELRLTNPDDLENSGVEIVAQPPGKKLGSVTLLSGGEKALTAISLVFAIFRIKPSPFCVLDEVDAPLDDANVTRFNAQVRRMAEKSQLIMITHKKMTMEACDALFGVTMEKRGISKIASAKLGDFEHLAN